ncbi:hypothetical protein SPRG_15408 [Saprolegnia parasitica CBS 223.65]|uniref:UBC core domain-containing protein n=1 Tax=Saprolegnia parasitica (strain CBS 223.65) TaxID=695850 RepID=A0A067BJT4_SAPPC|nr:hypothetical protein SPRG_15408 [Saprolegnia parasitica CBS 223.65]KDO18674.1 hypothetical protein SPRG_15408 [Saprolegnia parasitica CBS 223.65]|eukprot:XP_012210619.1 hypothetical protein SPRG_15408 [Saprolegnia parasitica CBS 223.65]
MSGLKTAFRHYQQYAKAPVPGCSIAHVDDNVFHVSTRLVDGIFRGVTVHWELTIPPSYPHSPPFGRILPDYGFTHEYHSHVFPDGICVDVLANHEYMHQSASRYGGWTPSSNLTLLMIYMQAFLADPDYSKPSAAAIARLRTMDAAYKCAVCGHDPAMSEIPDNESEVKEETTTLTPHLERVRREMVCPIRMENLVEHNVRLGYPLRVDAAPRRTTITLYPEIMSREAFDEALDAATTRRVPLRTPTGQSYTDWLPLYLHPSHVARHGKDVVFAPVGDMTYLDVLLRAMNSQIVAVMQGNEHESEAAIVAYANVLRLAKAYLAATPSAQATLNSQVGAFVRTPSERRKAAVPDLGEFFIKICLSSSRNHDFANRDTKAALFEEHFARQVRWIRQADAACVDFNVACPNRLGRLFAASETSNRMLTFAIEVSRTFGGADFEAQMDAHYGLPPSAVLRAFQDRIKRIKSSLTNYNILMQAWGYSDQIQSPDAMLAVLRAAVDQSARAGYDVSGRRSHANGPRGGSHSQRGRHNNQNRRY